TTHEPDRKIFHHETTRELKSPFMKISAICPNILRKYSATELNFSRTLGICNAERPNRNSSAKIILTYL
ncbi:hypothetical protein ACTXT7_017172, partial [Hymenolepis weldensis]